MKNVQLTSEKFAAFDNQFKSLSNDEMTSLRGGTIPPIPSEGGNDYPIDPFND